MTERYYIAARETGDEIDGPFASVEEAENIMETYEQADILEGTFEEGFYEIKTVED